MDLTAYELYKIKKEVEKIKDSSYETRYLYETTENILLKYLTKNDIDIEDIIFKYNEDMKSESVEHTKDSDETHLPEKVGDIVDEKSEKDEMVESDEDDFFTFDEIEDEDKDESINEKKESIFKKIFKKREKSNDRSSKKADIKTISIYLLLLIIVGVTSYFIYKNNILDFVLKQLKALF